MITTVLLLVCLITMLTMPFCQKNRNIKVISQELIKDNRAYIIDDKTHIIDTDLLNADCIDCSYSFNGERYRILVHDYFDLSTLNLGPDEENERYDIVKAELYKEKSPFTNDVTQKLKEYAGPYDDFYGKDMRTLDYKTMFSFVKTAPSDWLLRVHMKNGDIDIIHI